MAKVTAFTAERMKAIEDEAIVNGAVLLDDLILTRHDGTTINAGNVRGPRGLPGAPGIDAAPGSVNPTPNTTAIRTANGRVKVSDPEESNDATSKQYFDAANSKLLKLGLLQRVMTGGGVRKVSSVGVSWSQLFETVGIGVDTLSPAGHFQITMPPDGTIIPLYGNPSFTSVTVAAGTIPMTGWCALYYDIPYGSDKTSNPSRFKLIDYRTPMSSIPSSWILIVARNDDILSPMFTWGDGRAQDYWRSITLLNSWVAFGGGINTAGWKILNDGRVVLRGLIKNGTQGTPVAQLPAELAPEGGPLIHPVFSSGGVARVDINTAAQIVVSIYTSGASNASVSLDNLSWFPNGA